MSPPDLGHVLVGTMMPVLVTFTAKPTNPTDKIGPPTDPTTVVGKILAPGATTWTHYTYGTDSIITRKGVGLYEFDIDVTLADVWLAGMQGTGAVKASVDFTFTADPSPLGWT